MWVQTVIHYHKCITFYHIFPQNDIYIVFFVTIIFYIILNN